jgi:hypothetical protein
MMSNSDESEVVRRYLYTRYKLGDDPDQDPLKDGQNGYGVCEKMFTATDIPFSTFIYNGGKYHKLRENKKNSLHKIVCVRCPNNKTVPPDELELENYRCVLLLSETLHVGTKQQCQ